MINHAAILFNFLDAVQLDPRIGVSHISIYCALIQCSHIQEDANPIVIASKDVMRLAKISAVSTYHRCIKDLNDFGYIRYYPSFNHFKRKNKVYLPS